MSPEWNEALEGLLRAVLAGERDERDSEVRQAMESSAEFRARLAVHAGIARRLARFAAQRESILAELAGPAAEEEEGLLAAFREKARRAPRVRRSPARRRFLFALAGAAAVLVVWLWARRAGREEILDDGRFLGAPGAVELLEPKVWAARVPRFAWSASPDPRAFQYEFSLFDGDRPGAPELLLRTTTTAKEYVPSDPLPRVVWWSVQALDATGVAVGPPASARLSGED